MYSYIGPYEFIEYYNDNKLYEERKIDHNTGNNILDGETLLFKHYWKHKIIPLNKTQYTDEITKIYNTKYLSFKNI
jgi:hypothetical protein